MDGKDKRKNRREDICREGDNVFDLNFSTVTSI